MTCTLLLIDDHALIRAGVRALVSDLPDYTIIGEGANGEQLLELTASLKPDIILLELLPDSKVLILSMHTEPQLVMRALEGGARGYLLKDATATEIEHALNALRNDERYLSPAIAHTVINQALTSAQASRAETGHHPKLTARQLEILRLIVRGKSTREIAGGLGLSIKTVETHRAQIMKRLQIYDVAGLVLFCVREQIISLDD
jgi:DNA-binding NarL/FixJ family response regulator